MIDQLLMALAWVGILIAPLPHDSKTHRKLEVAEAIVIESDEWYDYDGGYLSAYGKMPTDGTIAYRQTEGTIPLDISEFDGVVAVLDCGRIGDVAMMTVGDEVFNVIVFDCAGLADGGWNWMIDGGYLAEIGYYMWEKYPHIIGKYATIAYVES